MNVRNSAGTGAAGAVKQQATTAGAGSGSGFDVPPGHAGRGWSELPPGIRKKVPKPAAATPAATPAATSTATASKASTQSPAQAVSDAQMERYLAELNAGRADRTKEPTGFMAWVRAQLQRERETTT